MHALPLPAPSHPQWNMHLFSKASALPEPRGQGQNVNIFPGAQLYFSCLETPYSLPLGGEVSKGRKTCSHASGQFVNRHQKTQSWNGEGQAACAPFFFPVPPRAATEGRTATWGLGLPWPPWRPAGAVSLLQETAATLNCSPDWPPSLSCPSHCILVTEFPHFFKVRAQAASPLINHRDVSINVFLIPNYIDDFAFKARRETANTHLTEIIKEIWKFQFTKPEDKVALLVVSTF